MGRYVWLPYYLDLHAQELVAVPDTAIEEAPLGL